MPKHVLQGASLFDKANRSTHMASAVRTSVTAALRCPFLARLGGDTTRAVGSVAGGCPHMAAALGRGALGRGEDVRVMSTIAAPPRAAEAAPAAAAAEAAVGAAFAAAASGDAMHGARVVAVAAAARARRGTARCCGTD
jgi:hypothetical protein